jgi:sulfate transport system permease protein
MSEIALALPGATTERPLARTLLIGLALLFLGLVLILPLVAVFAEAFRQGVGAYFAAFDDPDVFSAIRLTLLVAAIAVPLNLVFGVAAAWAIAKFDFPGKEPAHHAHRPALLDLAGGLGAPVRAALRRRTASSARRSRASGWRSSSRCRGLVLATVFVTFPFVARELIPLMQEQGTAEEEAAIDLGRSGWQMFFRVTLPNIRWALLYGVLLCNARAMGEFGAVSVVSGHIRGLTNTMPLYVEILYNEYAFVAAFAVASLLALLALVTLALKTFLEWRYADALASARRH